MLGGGGGGGGEGGLQENMPPKIRNKSVVYNFRHEQKKLIYIYFYYYFFLFGCISLNIYIFVPAFGKKISQIMGL